MSSLELRREFKAALRNCLNDLRGGLKFIYPKGMIPLTEHYRVKKTEDGYSLAAIYRANHNFPNISFLLHTQSKGFKELSSVFEELLREKDLLNKLYGNEQTAIRLDGNQLASSLIPFYIKRCPRLTYDDRSAESCYKRFHAHFATTNKTLRFYAYLEGIEMLPRRVTFFRNLVIRRLEDKHVARLYEMDAFFSDRYTMGRFPAIPMAPKMIIAGRIRTRFGDTSQKLDKTSEQTRNVRNRSPYEIVRDVVTSIRMVTNARVLVSPVIISQPLLPYEQRSSSIDRNLGQTAAWTPQGCPQLSYSAMNRARRICRVLQSDSAIHRRLEISRDRLDWSNHRSAQEDEVLDVMIGLEALTRRNLLKAKDEWSRGLAFDLSLSIARTLGKSRKEQLELFEIVRTAYGRLRSPLAHGDSFDQGDRALIDRSKEILRKMMALIVLKSSSFKPRSIKEYL